MNQSLDQVPAHLALAKVRTAFTNKKLSELPLEQSWTIWLDKYIGPNQPPEKYEEALVPLCTFDTVQCFWRWFNNLPAVNQLPPRSSYHMMKHGVKPLWEDPANQRGGSLCIKVAKQDTSYVWTQMVLAMIGEQLADLVSKEDEICGVTVSMRRDEDLIKIWNRNASMMDADSFFNKIKTLLPKVILVMPMYNVHSRLVKSSSR